MVFLWAEQQRYFPKFLLFNTNRGRSFWRPVRDEILVVLATAHQLIPSQEG
jgi:hypothetical protein